MKKRILALLLTVFFAGALKAENPSSANFWLSTINPVLIAVPIGIGSGFLARLIAQHLEKEPRRAIKTFTKNILCYCVIPLTRQAAIDSVHTQALENNVPFNRYLATLLAQAADWITYLKK